MPSEAKHMDQDTPLFCIELLESRTLLSAVPWDVAPMAARLPESSP